MLHARDIVAASLFAALTSIGAFIAIPLYLVPVTFQTFFTYLSGALLGGYLGALSQLIYLLLGCFGLPVFAGFKSGIAVLLGPTGGYLVGFVVGAFIIGKLVEIRAEGGCMWILFSMIMGTLAIYIFGIVQLSLWLKTSFTDAVLFGVLPFLIGDLLKMLLASFITVKVRKGLWRGSLARNCNEKRKFP
jgi:biotin transport system substrate-specific component